MFYFFRDAIIFKFFGDESCASVGNNSPRVSKNRRLLLKLSYYLRCVCRFGRIQPYKFCERVYHYKNMLITLPRSGQRPQMVNVICIKRQVIFFCRVKYPSCLSCFLSANIHATQFFQLLTLYSASSNLSKRSPQFLLPRNDLVHGPAL